MKTIFAVLLFMLLGSMQAHATDSATVLFTGKIVASPNNNQYTVIVSNPTDSTYTVYSTVTGRKLATFTDLASAQSFSSTIDKKESVPGAKVL